jgi:hypothetical protein
MGWSSYKGNSFLEAVTNYSKENFDGTEYRGQRSHHDIFIGEDGVWFLILPPEDDPYILFVLVDQHPIDLCDWMIKEIEEGMGPYFYDCPLSFLERAPVAPGPFSAKWRERVCAYHRGKDAT